MISGLDNEVEWSVGGMHRAHTQNPKESGMRTGLQWDPRSGCMVMNSNPGSLQWYRHSLDQTVRQVSVFQYLLLSPFRVWQTGGRRKGGREGETERERGRGGGGSVKDREERS